MVRAIRWVSVYVLVAAAACSSNSDDGSTTPANDTGIVAAKDANVPVDTGAQPLDSGLLEDAGAPDAAPEDAATQDAGGSPDAMQAIDAGQRFDADMVDASPPDADAPDAVAQDALPADANAPDAAAPDANAPDAAPEDAGLIADAGMVEDAGVGIDAELPEDVGPPHDVGVPHDGGAPEDVGPPPPDLTCRDITIAEACGGNAIGTWDYVDACGPSDVESQLMLLCPGVTINASSGSNLSGELVIGPSTYNLTFAEDINIDFTVPPNCAAVTGCAGLPFFIFGAGSTVTCQTNAQFGCDCAGGVPLRLVESGTYTTSGGVITTTSQTLQVTQYNYCVDSTGDVFRYRRSTVGSSYVLERR